MKIIMFLLLLFFCLPVVFADVSLANSTTSFYDISLLNKVNCGLAKVEGVADTANSWLSSIPLIGIHLESALTSLGMFNVKNEGLIQGDFCNNLDNFVTQVGWINNETLNFANRTANSKNSQELEDMAHYTMMENKRVATNKAALYSLLLMAIVWECIKIGIRLLQFYLIVWILLIGIPKVFLKIRDGMSVFLVRRKRRFSNE